MSTVLDVYNETVVRLPPEDQRQLAELILERLPPRKADTERRVHLADFLPTLPPGPRSFPTWDDFERAFQEERDSWDR